MDDGWVFGVKGAYRAREWGVFCGYFLVLFD